jgi:hypothetical protein
MADLPKYHISEQSAYALLRPVHGSVRELAARTEHYLGRLHLYGEADRTALTEAHQALRTATRELERIIATHEQMPTKPA